MRRISDATYVPIGWLIVGVASTWTIAAAGAFWVSGVNYRLARIEKHLGISEIADSKPGIIREASAGSK